MQRNRWRISPEVAGELGENTELDTTVHPPRVSRLHYRLEGWLGDDLLEVFPCLVVTARLAHAIQISDLTGWTLAPVEVTKSPEFEELYPDREIPEFRWLQIGGDPDADLSISSEQCLIVSDDALAMLRRFSLENAVIEPYFRPGDAVPE